MVYLVSACLAGVSCRFDGSSCARKEIRQWVAAGKALPVCPEQLGGLPTPRPPAEIVQGDGEDVLLGDAKVINDLGADVTPAFLRGAQETLKLAQLIGAQEALLKERSPSCGCTQIYRDSVLTSGEGVTAALLRQHGIHIRGIE